MLLLAALLGGLVWSLPIWFISWVAGLGLTWGVSYAIGAVVAVVVVTIVKINDRADARAKMLRR